MNKSVMIVCVLAAFACAPASVAVATVSPPAIVTAKQWGSKPMPIPRQPQASSAVDHHS